MKIEVPEKHPSNLAALQSAIKEVGIKKIFRDYCCKLIENMPRRPQETINTKMVTPNIINILVLSIVHELFVFSITLVANKS